MRLHSNLGYHSLWSPPCLCADHLMVESLLCRLPTCVHPYLVTVTLCNLVAVHLLSWACSLLVFGFALFSPMYWTSLAVVLDFHMSLTCVFDFPHESLDFCSWLSSLSLLSSLCSCVACSAMELCVPLLNAQRASLLFWSRLFYATLLPFTPLWSA